jgi:hypothetical protein
MSARLRLLIAADALGGVWQYSLELARALLPLGVEPVIAIFGPRPRNGPRPGGCDSSRPASRSTG